MEQYYQVYIGEPARAIREAAVNDPLLNNTCHTPIYDTIAQLIEWFDMQYSLVFYEFRKYFVRETGK